MSNKMEAIEAIKTVREYMPSSELNAIAHGCRTEEKQFFFDKLVEMAERINTMPVTYEQDGKGNKAIAYLHYFKGNQNWYITERDIGAPGDFEQRQAFGLADLGYGAELGYVSIMDLCKAGIELDMHFTPRTLEEIRTEAEAQASLS
jgi:hypothetical protein